jgi:hypothetical protein
MRYWSTSYNSRYVREDGEICDLSKVLKEDLSPQIIYDESVEIPKAVYKTIEKMMVGSPR